jgi:ABC-2 type transport system permease protein
LETLLTNPLTSVELCLGLVGFPFLFALARTVVYLGIAGAWMNLDVSQTSWPGLGLVLVSAAFALSALGILAGAIVLVLKRGDVLTGTIVFGMTLVSGSVFPISALPDWLEPIGKIVPTRFAFDGARAALFTGNGWETDAAFLAAFGVAALPLCLIAFSRALSYAKRSGSLAQY